MLIGVLSEQSGVSRDTIRFYEKKGLITGNIITRRDNNYKEYSEDVLEQLLLIKLLRKLSFTLEEIKTLSVNKIDNRLECNSLVRSVKQKLNVIETEMERLKKIKTKLNSVKNDCNDDCTFDKKVPSCLTC
ncbi:MerR family transcriptional regulator [Leptospira barantonii]|uniref:Transcriptional regulator n=1 Tax=Leptospira barantonii TaxID=2023184 RepID=A0ABX4NNJ7_9LEPT|nr:MerR family transcriptional regulator [Leptospira barantonii]PJZ58411.1 transcriptional regulator [Leptospira barantonii]